MAPERTSTRASIPPQVSSNPSELLRRPAHSPFGGRAVAPGPAGLEGTNWAAPNPVNGINGKVAGPGLSKVRLELRPDMRTAPARAGPKKPPGKEVERR